MKKWIWYQESLPCKVVIKSIIDDLRASKYKKWRKIRCGKAKQKDGKNESKEWQTYKLVLFELLHNVILCLSYELVLLFLGYMIGRNSKFFTFFFKSCFLKMLFFGTPAKISQECLIQSAWNFQAFLSTLRTIQWVEKIWVILVLNLG